MDTPAVHTVTIYKYMDILGKGLHRVLHRVLHNTRPPNVAGWCQRFLHRRAAVLLIHHAPKSYNLPILIQVVPTIALWLRRPDHRSFTALPLSNKVAKANSPLALNQQIKWRLQNICSNVTIPLKRHTQPPRRCFVRRLFKQYLIQPRTAWLLKLIISSYFLAKQPSMYISCNISSFSYQQILKWMV